MIGGGGCTKKQTDRLTVEQPKKSPPVFYRASSPLEPLPKRHLNCLETSPGVHGGPWDPHHWIFRHVRAYSTPTDEVKEIIKINGTLCACEIYDKTKEKQGRIHGHQLRTDGQERKCAFSHFSTRAHRPTDQPTDRPTDGRTKPLIELRVRN